MADDKLTPEEQRIADAADRMLARGQNPAEVEAFVERALSRLAANAADQAEAKKLSGVGKAGVFLDRVAGGATFGLAPLVIDAAYANLDPNRSFADLRAERNDRNEQLGPLGYAADIVGGLATGGASLNAIRQLQNVGKAGKIALAAGDAALQGGVTGGAEGLNEISREGFKRAGTRGAIGAAIGLPLGAVGGAVGGRAAEYFAGRKLAKQLTDAGVNVNEAKALVKQFEDMAPNDVAAAMGRIDEFVKAGKGADVMAADVLGVEGGRALRAATNISKRGDELASGRIRTRDANIGPRAKADLEAAAGYTPTETAQGISERVTAKEAAAAPLYDRFRALGELPLTPDLKDVMDAPVVRRAIADAKSEFGLHKLPDTDARVLDAARKKLSDKAWSAGRYETGETVSALTDAMDGASGGLYKPAVESFAGPAAIEDAYRVGRQMQGKRAGDVRGELRKAGSNADEVKRGIIDATGERISMRAPNPDLGPAARGGTGVGTEAVGTLNSKEILPEVLGPQGYETLVGRSKLEGDFARTSHAAQGNSTSAKQIADAAPGFLDLAGDVVSGAGLGPASWATSIGRKVGAETMSDFRKWLNNKSATAVADALTRSGESEARGVFESVLAEMARRQGAASVGRKVGTRVQRATQRASGRND